MALALTQHCSTTLSTSSLLNVNMQGHPTKVMESIMGSFGQQVLPDKAPQIKRLDTHWCR